MKKIKNYTLLKTLVIAFLMFVALELFIVYSITITKDRLDLDLERKSSAIQNEMDKILLNVYTISDAYFSYITENPDATREDTESFLKHLMEYEEKYVKNIAYVEDTTIKFNYPYEENQSSIGVDLSKVDGQSEIVQELMDNKEYIFQGPIELVQGGNAFILRTPIVQDEEYIGHISTVIDADRLFAVMTEQAQANNVDIKIGYELPDIFFEIGNDFTGVSVIDTMKTSYVNFDFIVYDQSTLSITNLINFGARSIGILLILIYSYYFYRNRRLMEDIKYNVYHDTLTKKFNRDKFIYDFYNTSFSNKLIAFIDINKFKVLNDTLGHHYGDWTLFQLANDFELQNKFIIYRNSGDEFILVSKEEMNGQEFTRYLDTLKLSYFNETLNRNIELGLSLGVIERVESNLKLEDMLIYLDYAMYDSKKNNRTMTIVDNKLMAVYENQKIIEQLLIEDIKDNKLELYYQPIININEKRVESLEVLSRWRYQGEIIPASKFIDVAKKIKYIEVLDQNLFKKLQKDYTAFKAQLKTDENLNFAVNFSSETLKLFEQNNLLFDQFVENNNIPKENLMFEISEDINLGVISNATLKYIKEAGYNLVIDDFGSGVSKLSDVLSGKLLAIKTDRSMLPKDFKDVQKLKGFNTILKAIHAAGSFVVAEGVETSEQLEICKNAGVNTVQGYLFAKPMPFNEVIEYISTFDYSDYEKK